MLTSCRKYKLKLKWYNLLHPTSTLHCQPEKKKEEEETMSRRNLCQLSTSFHSQGEMAPTVKGREKTQSPRVTVSSQGHCCLVVLTAAEMIGLLLQESFIKYQE